MNCKFWMDGYCLHKEAPKSNLSCIGKASCVAWRDGNENYSQANYRIVKELIKSRVN